MADNPSKADALRAMRETKYAANHSRGVAEGLVAPKTAAMGHSAPVPRETHPVAKATKGKAGTAVVTDHVRRSSAGTGLRVGEAVAVQPATSEKMDVTAGETAPISKRGRPRKPDHELSRAGKYRRKAEEKAK